MNYVSPDGTGAVVVVGFDAAWTDNPRKPGAICAARVVEGSCVGSHRPRLVSFDEGLDFIRSVEVPGTPTLVALDLPTIVTNLSGSRPVDKVAGSLISWLDGGVQPANRSKVGMFDDGVPIWRFMKALGASKDPEEARAAHSGRHLIEVFPALALPALEPSFFARLAGPRYNPERHKTFKAGHWSKVLKVVAAEAQRLGCVAAAEWLADLDVYPVRKADQDRLGAIICLLVGIRWRLEPRDSSVVLGCANLGYMVAPVTSPMHERLSTAAALSGVPVDHLIPPSGPFA